MILPLGGICCRRRAMWAPLRRGNICSTYISDVDSVEKRTKDKHRKERQAFGRALEHALADARMTQSELARRYAEATGSKVTPSKVSDWTKGESLPENGDPDAIFLVEKLLGVAPGSLTRHLGYVPVATQGCTVEVAIDSDPLLGEWARDNLHMQYRALLTAPRG